MHWKPPSAFPSLGEGEADAKRLEERAQPRHVVEEVVGPAEVIAESNAAHVDVQQIRHRLDGTQNVRRAETRPEHAGLEVVHRARLDERKLPRVVPAIAALEELREAVKRAVARDVCERRFAGDDDHGRDAVSATPSEWRGSWRRRARAP